MNPVHILAEKGVQGIARFVRGELMGTGMAPDAIFELSGGEY